MSTSTKPRIKKYDYLKLVGFSTPQEAYQKIKDWSSGLSDNQHLIRSVILDIHTGIESLLKQILFNYMKELIFQSGEKNDKKRLEDFLETVNNLSFFNIYRLMKPIFDSWPKPDLISIGSINDLRNQIAHGKSIDKIQYKNRNPFKEADSFAQLFFDAWAVRKELKEFYQHAISDPREMRKLYYQEYQKNTNTDK